VTGTYGSKKPVNPFYPIISSDAPVLEAITGQPRDIA